jgi:cytochrome c-type biogenesis protein
MTELFDALVRMLQAPGTALPAAFAWGILGMVLSPCHLAGLPLLISYVNGQEPGSPKHAAVLSSAFALGMLLAITLLGVVSALAGRLMIRLETAGYCLAAIVFLLVGLEMLDVISLPWFHPRKERVHRKGLPGALLLGTVFGLASGPCTLAFLAPVLAFACKTGTTHPAFAFFSVLLFGLGNTLIVVLAGTFSEKALRFAEWNRKKKAARRARMVLGGLLIAGGLYFIYRAA